MISFKSALKIIALLVGGAVLNVLLLAFAEAALEKQVQLRQHLLEAQQSPAASGSLSEAFRTKDVLADFIVVPMIGCLIGAYAGVLQRRKPGLLAVACLLPMFLYEVASQPVGAWPAQVDARYFGMRLLGFLLAIAVAASLRGLRDKRASAAVPTRSM